MIFSEQVYASLRLVPAGRVTTYKDLANAVGSSAYRAVGQVLRRNPDAPGTPCHRVVASDGAIGGFMGDKDGQAVVKKVSLLADEGVVVQEGKIRDFEKVRFVFRGVS